MSGKVKHIRYSQANEVSLVKGGSSYFNLLLECIHRAQHSIHIQVYIFDDDTTGQLVAKALVKAAERGVAVFILADGFASQGVRNGFIREIRKSGIHFRFFEPLWKSTRFYFGRRMHQKLVVTDGKEALVGGLNIADRYNDVDGIPAWLDYAVYVKGRVAYELYRHCRTYWKGEETFPEPPTPLSHVKHPCSVRISRNDWVKGKHEIWKTYFNLFNKAQESITIVCSYFLPGRTLRRQLAKAARRGVKVRVILAGPSDVALAKYAERYLYDWMLRNGIELYEYQHSVLHAKMTVVDSHWVTIGSYNINNISAYASIELNLDIRNRPFGRMVQQELNKIISEDCVQITQKSFTPHLTLLKRFLQKSSYEIVRMATHLFTFYFRHE